METRQQACASMRKLYRTWVWTSLMDGSFGLFQLLGLVIIPGMLWKAWCAGFLAWAVMNIRRRLRNIDLYVKGIYEAGGSND